jgi:CRP-like cAMP-binding protein
MTKDILAILENTFLFRGLSTEDLIEVASKFQRRTLEKTQVLFRKGDRGDSLFIIARGWFKIVSEDSTGNELVLNQCGPGESIGEMSLLDCEPRSASVVALEQAEVLELNRGAFLDVLAHNPDLSMLVIRKISSRLRFASTYLEKAIEWSKRIGEGDYSFALKQLSVEEPFAPDSSDEEKARKFFSAFFNMVKGVKEREENLKQELQKLTLVVDEVRRKREVEEITQTEFYADLKAKARELRQKRAQERA